MRKQQIKDIYLRKGKSLNRVEKGKLEREEAKLDAEEKALREEEKVLLDSVKYKKVVAKKS